MYLYKANISIYHSLLIMTIMEANLYTFSVMHISVIWLLGGGSEMNVIDYMLYEKPPADRGWQSFENIIEYNTNCSIL